MSDDFLPGTRVPARIIRGLMVDGLTAAEIAAFYPSVTPEHVASLRTVEDIYGTPVPNRAWTAEYPAPTGEAPSE